MSRHTEIKATKVLGKHVTDRNGTNVGIINDLIIEPDRGMIIYIMLELATGRTVSIPYNALTTEDDADDHLTLNLDHATIQSTTKKEDTTRSDN